MHGVLNELAKIGESAIALIYISALLFALLGCGLIADYALPHIGRLDRWIESLPLMNDKGREE